MQDMAHLPRLILNKPQKSGNKKFSKNKLMNMRATDFAGYDGN